MLEHLSHTKDFKIFFESERLENRAETRNRCWENFEHFSWDRLLARLQAGSARNCERLAEIHLQRLDSWDKCSAELGIKVQGMKDLLPDPGPLKAYGDAESMRRVEAEDTRIA